MKAIKVVMKKAIKVVMKKAIKVPEPTNSSDLPGSRNP
jgi:hypothetical protein